MGIVFNSWTLTPGSPNFIRPEEDEWETVFADLQKRCEAHEREDLVQEPGLRDFGAGIL